MGEKCLFCMMRKLMTEAKKGSPSLLAFLSTSPFFWQRRVRASPQSYARNSEALISRFLLPPLLAGRGKKEGKGNSREVAPLPPSPPLL